MNLKNQQGLSLIELMISLTIGLVLMGGAIHMFLSSRAVFATQQAVSRVQESGRMAIDFMARDVRMAGFMGCMTRNTEMVNLLNNSNDHRYRFRIALEGATAPAPVGSGYPAAAIPGTDMLVVRRGSSQSVNVVSGLLSDELRIAHTGKEAALCHGGGDRLSGLCSQDIVVVTDCEKSRIFQITDLAEVGTSAVTLGRTGTGGSPGNAVTSWGGPSSSPAEQFGDDSEVMKLYTTVYYIALNGAGRPSLWESVNGQAEELLTGIQDMRLSYGVPSVSGGPPDNYLAASAVTDWGQVGSVRVQLLVQSTEDGVLSEPQPYSFNGVAVANPGDRRLRQVFTNTIAVRSRLP